MAGDTIKETLMKRLLILLLLLPSLAWGEDYARMNPYVLGAGVSAAALHYCASSTANQSTTGFLCEDFQGDAECETGFTSNCRSAWTVDAACAGDPNYQATGLAGTYSLNLTENAVSASCTKYRTFSSSANAYAYFMIKIAEIADMSGTEKQDVACLGATRCCLTVGYNTDNYYFGVDVSGTATYSTVTPSTTQVYHVWLEHLQATSCTAYISTTSTKPVATVSATGANITVDRFWVGAYKWGGIYIVNDVTIDNIFVDDAAIGDQ
jgi:hypothetical protein